MLTELMPYWLAGMLLAGALIGLATGQRLARWFRAQHALGTPEIVVQGNGRTFRQ